MRNAYDHQAIERAAQEKWATLDLHRTDLTDTAKDPYYLLFEFPYPSGDLHIGHWYAFALTDIFARYKKATGKNVLFPMGFDSFGLPAENAAMKYGKDPKEWTYENMERMRAQVRSMGTMLDWSKEIVTSDPEYYRWTQWLFAKLFEHGLAERRNAPVKWCPKDQTVLANEQVNDGKCERCGTEVEEKNLTQWFLKITQYARRLLDDLDPLPWREDIKDAQRAWIGESEGAKLSFALHSEQEDEEGNVPGLLDMDVEVFTTRPDTLFGVTYVVLAPEHPFVETLMGSVLNPDQVRAYVEATKKKTERERQEEKEKTGVRLGGILAKNPASGEFVPVYIADYVLATYGTGAVMAVPAHDERDFAFAKKFDLPMKTVVEPKFVATAGESAVKEGEEMVPREAVCAVVRNTEDDTYLCISWKEIRMQGLVTGGIEEGEDPVEAARREVHEETGYKNLRHIERPEVAINSVFYHRVKQQNRSAHFRYVFFELEDDARDPVDEKESAQHEVLWKPRKELRDFFTVCEGEFILNLVDGKDFIYTDAGVLVNSGAFTGRDSLEAKWDIVTTAGGERVTNYRIRDWLVSRQRYWGCPIPVVYDPEGNAHLVPSEHLPWLLPTDVDFSLNEGSPLSTSKELKERVVNLFGEGWTPEYDTLDTFVDSSWYFLRYLASDDEHAFSDQDLLKKWIPVDRYSGGSEHTTMHLLYARFFHKALYDLALVPTPEPFHERFNRGLILGPDGQKMSKSKGNVINPDEFVGKYGADAVRMYLAFIGPYNEPGSYPWSLDGVFSMRKFLDRVAALAESVTDGEPSKELEEELGKAISKVSVDTERFKFNTAISGLMIGLKALEKESALSRKAYHTFLKLLAPFAPHLAEHLWEATGGEGSIHAAAWPDVPEMLVREATVIVQINGKKRGELSLPTDTSEEDACGAAKGLPAVEKALHEGSLSRVIYVPGRILNLVITGI